MAQTSAWTWPKTLGCRDPATILPEKIEGALLTALDNENDGAIAAQIQATLQTLLRAGAGGAPSYWLSVCSAVALSAPAAAPRASGGARESGTGKRRVLVRFQGLDVLVVLSRTVSLCVRGRVA